MNPHLDQLHAYPFQKLTSLKAGITPAAVGNSIALSIGEPKHLPPASVVAALRDSLNRLGEYPATLGLIELRNAIARWLTQRFGLRSIDPATQILPCNGTREALFSFAQAVINPSRSPQGKKPVVVMPNPFYQIYEGAALLAGAECYYAPTTADNDFLVDYSAVPESIWQRCQLVYHCTPGNPTGAVSPSGQMAQLIKLADQYDFAIASDECYSELYLDEANPPLGMLEVCQQLGRENFARVAVFHSLSKRSNLPGLRSGFVAGDANLLKPYLQYRTYHGCAMPVPSQLASTVAWQDETHVIDNRARYREKFARVGEVLGDLLEFPRPTASFYLWAKTPGGALEDDRDFARELFASQNVTVLPGQFLSREVDGVNPGAGRVRIALVAELEECLEAAHRIRQFLTGSRHPLAQGQ